MEAGAIEALLDALECHGRSHAKLAEFCFAALAFVVGDACTRLPLRAMGSYLDVMRAQAEAPKVQHYGCLTIAYALEEDDGKVAKEEDEPGEEIEASRPPGSAHRESLALALLGNGGFGVVAEC